MKGSISEFRNSGAVTTELDMGLPATQDIHGAFGSKNVSWLNIFSCRRQLDRSALARSCGCPIVARKASSRLRWPTTDGRPVCPNFGCMSCHDCRRGESARRRCKACGGDFSATSGTLFAWRKLPLRTYLLAIVMFCNEAKGKSRLALSRELGVQYKTAFVLAHKLREAMTSATRGLMAELLPPTLQLATQNSG